MLSKIILLRRMELSLKYIALHPLPRIFGTDCLILKKAYIRHIRCVLSNKIICNVYIYINDKFNRNYVMFLWITEQLLSNDIVGPRYVLLMELSFHLTYRAHTAHVTCHWKSVQLCFAGATCPTLRPLYCAFEFAPS